MKTLAEQPYDSELLKRSALYLQSRKNFLAGHGTFRSALLSSARTLGSASLVENRVSYSPVGSELNWSVTDRLQKKDSKHFDQIRSFVTNIYHEQNHRTLWNHFRKKGIYCPQTRAEAYRFLNLVESLVVILDMALGDELSKSAAYSLKQMNVIYDSGVDFMRKIKSAREYRNSLQVSQHATFLLLEGLHPEDIPLHVGRVFSGFNAKLVAASVRRALSLDVLFVELTNPIWQKKHVPIVMKSFAPPRGQRGLILPSRKPLENRQAYLITEKWLERFGL